MDWRISNTSPLAGVTLGLEMSFEASSTGSIVTLQPRLKPLKSRDVAPFYPISFIFAAGTSPAGMIKSEFVRTSVLSMRLW
jgi:hypothetical protein